MSNFIISNATNQIITVDHLCLEVGHHVEQESLSRNMVIAKNLGLITIALGDSGEPFPNSFLRNPNGQDIPLFPEQLEQALGYVPAQSGGGSSGTVTSVGLTLPSIFAVAGSPITSSGTFAVSLTSQTAGQVFAAPAGANGVPSFRAIAATDLPVATASVVGVVKPGTGLAVAGDGTLNVTTTVPTAANPTASAGLTAVNGTATTFMRSDAAPAINQAIAPTWSGQHTFSLSPVVPTVAGSTDSTTKAASTAFVQNVIAAKVVPSTTSVAGIAKQSVFQAQLSAAPTQQDFNTLLTNLITAGLMAAA